MLNHLLAISGPAKMAGLDGNVIGTWISDNIFFVLVVVVACAIACFAIAKKPRDAIISFSIILLAMALMSLAIYRNEIGQWFAHTFFGV